MLRLSTIMDLDLLNQHIADKLVRRQTHPLYPELSVLVYTEQATFSRTWDEVTNNCRGLITVTDKGVEYILARPYPKFHNLNTEYIPETMENNLPDETPVFSTKLDGSMGIIFEYDNLLHVATKGSFDSDQARWATAFIRKNHPMIFRCVELSMPWLEDRDITPVVEIISPTSRIVVDYKGMEALILTGLIENDTGKEFDRSECQRFSTITGIPLVEAFNKTLAECCAENTPNAEGYVVTYPSTGLKIKIKFEEYCRLHRVVTGLNPRAVWEFLSTGQMKPIKLWLEDKSLPEDFRTWVRNVEQGLRKAYREEAWAVYALWAELLKQEMKPETFEDKVERKGIAQMISDLKSPYSSLLFNMLTGKAIEPELWDRVYPKHTDTFRKDGE